MRNLFWRAIGSDDANVRARIKSSSKANGRVGVTDQVIYSFVINNISQSLFGMGRHRQERALVMELLHR